MCCQVSLQREVWLTVLLVCFHRYTWLSTGLSFEQQKELLLLQIEHDKLQHTAEVKKQLALETMKYETEQARV